MIMDPPNPCWLHVSYQSISKGPHPALSSFLDESMFVGTDMLVGPGVFCSIFSTATKERAQDRVI